MEEVGKMHEGEAGDSKRKMEEKVWVVILVVVMVVVIVVVGVTWHSEVVFVYVSDMEVVVKSRENWRMKQSDKHIKGKYKENDEENEKE